MNEIYISPDPSPGDDRIFVMHQLEDFDKWYGVYEGNADKRKEVGLTARAILADKDDPNKIGVIFHYSDKEKLDEYMASEELQELMIVSQTSLVS